MFRQEFLDEGGTMVKVLISWRVSLAVGLFPFVVIAEEQNIAISFGRWGWD